MLQKVKKICKEIVQLSNRERCLLIITSCWLIIGVFYKKFLSFKRITKHLGKQNFDPKTELDLKKRNELANLQIIFSKVAYALPLQTTCLVRAFAMSKILKSRNIPHTVFIGVDLNARKKIAAHAWVRSGSLDVLGCCGEVTYNIISTFGYECRDTNEC